MLRTLFIALCLFTSVAHAGIGKNLGCVALTFPPLALIVSKTEHAKNEQKYTFLENLYNEASEKFTESQKERFGKIVQVNVSEDVTVDLNQKTLELFKAKRNFWKNAAKASEWLVAAELGALATYAKIRKGSLK